MRAPSRVIGLLLVLATAGALLALMTFSAPTRGPASDAVPGDVHIDFAPTRELLGGTVPQRNDAAPNTLPQASGNFTPLPRAQTTPAMRGNSRCPIQDLPAGWHVSSTCSFTQTETQGAGPMTCQIKRDSCQFARLVTVRDPRIRFYNEEQSPYNDEDALMHPAMLAPVSRLRQLVDDEWAGAYQLYVTDTYDSLGDHDLAQPVLGRKYSLHFEGLSIDFVTYPVEPARYSRLCALAIAAGFDWVHNEVDHCHASLRAPTLCTACR